MCKFNFSNWDIPDYQIDQIAPKNSQYCVCIFVLNEGKRIQNQLIKMQPFAEKIDIIIADGGSTDGALALDFLQSVQVGTLLTKRGSGQLSAQMRMAFAYALTAGYEGIITMDGNNKDDPQGIPRFIDALQQYDHIQGSRFIPGGQAINTPWLRYGAIRLIHAPLISWASGFHYTDTTNGFRGYSRRFLLDPKVAPFREIFCRYELHYYLAIRAARLGYKITEIPVTRRYPDQGKTPTKISPFRGNLLVLQTLLKACLHQFNP